MRTLIAVVVLVWAGAAAAQQSEQPQDLRERVRACSAVTDTAQRLTCYDQLGTEVAQAPPDAWSVPISRARVEQVQRESFGLSLPNLTALLPDLGGGSVEVDSIDVQVDRILERGDGSYVFIMSNGQRWVQIDPRRVVNVRSGDTVHIRQGAMSSFMLTSPRGGRPHRVRREN